MKHFEGTGVAIVTPFRSDASLDFPSLGKLVEFLLQNKVDYLVVLGTTGESVTLNKEEKRAVVDYVIEQNNSRVPIVMGMGGNNTHEIVNQIQKNSMEGIDAILSVAPYYNKPNQKGLFQHYNTIATASPVPVILYNVPGRTGSNILPETTIELAHKIDNIIGIKEASGNLDAIAYIAKNKPHDFQIISGDDALTIPIISLGGSGVISVLANAFPNEVSDIVNLSLKNKFNKACSIYFQFLELITLLFQDGNPAGIKAVLHQMNRISNALRLPLTPVQTSTYNRITKVLAEIKAGSPEK